MHLLHAAALLAALRGLLPAAPPQPTHEIAGIVADATGAVLPGVSVSVAGNDQTRLCGTTDDSGRYKCDGLLPGPYAVTVRLSGFEPATSSAQVDADGGVALNFVLSLSPLSERVTVTATRTGVVDLQSTPAAITALSARTLAERGVSTIDRVAGLAPATTITQSTGGSPLVSIRGIGTNAFTTGADPSTSVYLDGVYLGRPAMNATELLDVERIEVLRGPQGTLYGRNSVGGAINVVTRVPTNVPEATARVSVGDHGHFRADTAVGGPILRNRLFGGLTVLRAAGGGYIDDLSHPDRPLGSDDTWATRGQIRTVFRSGGEISVSGDYGQFDGVPATISKPLVAKPGFAFEQMSDPWTVRTSHLTAGRNRQYGALTRVALPLRGSLRLTSLTAYRSSDYRYLIDADGTELPLLIGDIPDRQHQISEEVTLVRHTPRLTWVGGLFLYADHNDGPAEVTLFPTSTQTRLFPDIDTDARALFGQASYLVLPRLSLTGGLRFTHEQKDLKNRGGVYVLGTDILANPATYYDYSDSATWQAWTPRAGLELRLTPDAFAYVSATRGFKSGGFNTTARTASNRFTPEYAWSYEAGLKRTVADGRLRTNLAAFVNDYRDLQVFSFLAPGVYEINNAGKATIAGVEFEVNAVASRRFQVAGALSWLDATYDHYLARVGNGAVLDAAGHALNNAPVWSGSSSLISELEAPGGSIVFRADGSWQSRVYFTPANDQIETQGPYGLLHTRVTFEPRNPHWTLAFFVRNVFEQPYITGTLNTAPAAITAHPGEPRRWGTELTLRY